MSELIVQISRVDEVLPHPEPSIERLEIVKVKGWFCMVRKGIYKVGDLCLYIPVDSVLPKELEEFLFKEAKIKPENGRIRSIKFKGAVSQGLIVSLDDIVSYLAGKVMCINFFEGQDFSAELGITKYEPPLSSIPRNMQGKSVKKKHPDFKEYTDISHLKWTPDIFEHGEPVYITEKLHGCLTFRSKVTLADGSKMNIGDIVNKKLPVDVLGLDESGKVVPTKIVNWFNNGSTRDWVKVRFTQNGIRNNNQSSVITCTPGHRFHTLDRGWVEAGKLNSGDTLLTHTLRVKPSYLQKQILLGKMLGDGCLRKGVSVEFGHKKDHEEYIDYTVSCLGKLAHKSASEFTSGYGTLMVRAKTRASAYIGEMFSDWFVEGVKEVPSSIIGDLTPISMAFWYMDDGSLGHSESQEDRANFATCGFSKESVDNLVSAFKKFDIEASPYRADGYWRLRLNKDEAEKFFLLIAPYIPAVMQYKLPEKLRGMTPHLQQNDGELVKETLLVTNKVISVDPFLNDTRIKYDLETETHNFFVNQTLVHNSSFRCGLLPTHVNNPVKKLMKRFGILKDYEFVYGSRRVQLDLKILYDGYYGGPLAKLKRVFNLLKRGELSQAKEYLLEKSPAPVGNVYAKMVKQYNLREVLKPNEALYGEIIGPGIQKGYHYGLKEGRHELYAYDVMVDGKFLDSKEFIEWCNTRFIKRVPLLHYGAYEYNLADQLRSGDSLVGGQKIREGCVIKPMKERNEPSVGRVAIKFVNDDYYLQTENTDLH